MLRRWDDSRENSFKDLNDYLKQGKRGATLGALYSC